MAGRLDMSVQNNEYSLFSKLKEYSQTDIYPFHMPGHKRNNDISYVPVDIDITEIEGFDNLHNADGILKQAEDFAAQFFGADRSWFLINGSTVGLLIAVSTVASNNGGTLLMARNCHKSAYNAAFLNRMKIKYLYPEKYICDGVSFNGSISPDQLINCFNEINDIKAVLITSPTYDGIISDIASIADICHKNNVPLIVDEAHGAHLVLYERFASDLKSALSLGADIVVHSLHKTLPSMTQTALLHLRKGRVSEEVIKKYSLIYQSSSPSYVMMAGIDSCIRFIKSKGEIYYHRFIAELRDFYLKTKSLKKLKVYINEVPQRNVFAKDISKILIFCSGLKNKYTGQVCDGQWLYEVLLKDYHLQMEMSAANYVLALTSIMDSREGFNRLYEALYEIDNDLVENGNEKFLETGLYNAPEIVCSIYEADNKNLKKVPLRESIGGVSGEYVYLYPPGCPIIVPGERINRAIISQIEEYKARNFNIEGLKDKSFENIEIFY